MTAIDWILTLCGGLMVAGIGAIATIAWGLKGSFEAFKGEVSARMSAIETQVDARFVSMSKVVELQVSGMREVVEIQVGHLAEKIESFGQFENRMTAVEQTASVFREAFDDYKPWRARVDEKLANADKRLDGEAARISAMEQRSGERKS